MRGSGIVLELTGKESQMLQEILGSHLSHLRMEMRGTDSKEWREYLREKERFIEEMMARLPAFGRIT